MSAGGWKGVSVRIAVFKQEWCLGRMRELEVSRLKTRLDGCTMSDLFDQYPPEQGYTFTITPRRAGDTTDA